VLLIVEELDIYLQRKDKSLILNVLDGMETPNNPRGALLLATTNYPEVIDERIAKRPGRVDRIIHVPPIQDLEQAERMLMHYMGPQWRDEHRVILADLIGQTGAFRARGIGLCSNAGGKRATDSCLGRKPPSVGDAPHHPTRIRHRSDAAPSDGFVGLGVGTEFSTNRNVPDLS